MIRSCWVAKWINLSKLFSFFFNFFFFFHKSCTFHHLETVVRNTDQENGINPQWTVKVAVNNVHLNLRLQALHVCEMKETDCTEGSKDRLKQGKHLQLQQVQIAHGTERVSRINYFLPSRNVSQSGWQWFQCWHHQSRLCIWSRSLWPNENSSPLPQITKHQTLHNAKHLLLSQVYNGIRIKNRTGPNAAFI